MQKITPFLWFDGKAEEAAQFYAGIFKNSKIHDVKRYGDGAPVPKGTVLSVTFELDGQQFIALNAGPQHPFTPAISLFVSCDTQEEVDEFWEKLSAGGQQQRCGWLTDKYGLSWQVVPKILGDMLSDPDRDKARRAMDALMTMNKFDIAALTRAFDGR